MRMRIDLRWLFVLLVVLCCGASLAQPESLHLQAQLDRILSRIGAHAGRALGADAPVLTQELASQTNGKRSSLLSSAMAAPLQLPALIEVLERRWRRAVDSPARLLAEAIALSMAPRDSPAVEPHQPRAWSCASNPLAAVMGEVFGVQASANSSSAAQGDALRGAWPLSNAIARVVAAAGAAESKRQAAFRQLPADVVASRLVAQLLSPDTNDSPHDDYRTWLALVDREALHAGMLELAGAIESLDHALQSMPDGPPVHWRWATPLGEVVVDTTGSSNVHRQRDTLLVVDVGGDDAYYFEPPSPSHRISVVMDRGGNDRYVAPSPGSDPSSAVMGYGILWDAGGDDSYEGDQFTQGAALLGVALHVDRDGRNRYQATGHAQSFAAGGVAVLAAGSGEDDYVALTHAQASAGPQGVAILVDTGGDDRYQLGNTPLVLPSSQSPELNVSMGQGAARGERSAPGGRVLSGGIGVLFDLGGNDVYQAQVFAQGAGYFEGVGILMDGGGRDVFEGAWYAMGAAAHTAVGVLIKRGPAADRYLTSHSTSLGAAHDFSVAMFADEGGDDVYRLGTLGLGASHDNSVAVFLDLQGDDVYQVGEAICNVLGATLLSDPNPRRDDAPAFALFADTGGTDLYQTGCVHANNTRIWRAPQNTGERRMRSDRGVGLDTDHRL